MSNVFFSPEGNPEVWEEKPEAYFTPEEWAEMHPAPPPPPFTPGPDFAQREDGTWYRFRYTRLGFIQWVGVDKYIVAQQQIAASNPVVMAIRDLIMAAEFISLQDPATVQMLHMMASPEAGCIIAPADVARILAGEDWVEPEAEQ